MISVACNLLLPHAKWTQWNRLPFATAQKVICPFSILLKGIIEHHMQIQQIFEGNAGGTPWKQFANGAQITFRAVAKGNLLCFATPPGELK